VYLIALSNLIRGYDGQGVVIQPEKDKPAEVRSVALPPFGAFHRSIGVAS